MTDKQIKEGIDVSQCECYSVEGNSCNKTLSGSCIKEKCQTFRLLQTIQVKEQKCEELKHQIEDVDTLCSEKESLIDKYFQTLIEIKEIAEGMHDLWINKTKYTDIDNLVKHLLECELSRIIYKLDEISKCEVENNEKN